MRHFAANRFYHVYNRSGHNEPLFMEDRDKDFFVKQLNLYLSDYISTYGHLLFATHFHLLIRCKNIEGVVSSLSKKIKQTKKSSENLTKTQLNFIENPSDISFNKLIGVQFLKFFTSYSMNYNHIYDHTGNLFHTPYQRNEIESESHFSYLVFYCHRNIIINNLLHRAMDSENRSITEMIGDEVRHSSYHDIIEHFEHKQFFMDFHSKDVRVK